MSIDEIKSVSMTSYLSFLGYKPKRKSNGKFWYLSPLHQETTPSFKVNTALNLWYDHALGKGGNIINFAALIYPHLTMHELLKLLQKQIKDNRLEYESDSCQKPASEESDISDNSKDLNSKSATKITSIRPITNRNLISYISSRGIPIEVARQYCREIYYWIPTTGKHYYGICFPNALSGYEVRSRYAKRCIGRKSYSFIRTSEEASSCCIFEGFFDFLSFLSSGNNLFCDKLMTIKTDFIILNSIYTLSQVHSVICTYTFLYCFFDNDQSGKTALEKMKKLYPGKVVDKSYLYKAYKDFNEALMEKRKGSK